MNFRSHWEDVYATKRANQVSWHRPHLDVSLELLERAGLNERSRVIDAGGGASTLVDDLLDRGVRAITVLDLAATSLEAARHRLGARAHQVQWIVSDVTAFDAAPESFDLWHDRAALHFLVDPQATRDYVRIAAAAIARGGYAVIGCFAQDGPEKCSGLPVMRRDPEDIAALFGPRFMMVGSRRELHHTPSGGVQRFAYALLRKE